MKIDSYEAVNKSNKIKDEDEAMTAKDEVIWLCVWFYKGRSHLFS
jgi:hypothetical protein